jgi:SHS2 domain-containing protein
MKYELLDHTADAKFRAYGKTREEAFTNAVEAMTAIVAEPAKLHRVKSIPVHIEATSLKRVLFDLLDEILFLHDTEHFLPACAEHLKIREEGEHFVLDAVLHGDEASKWPGNLKAVTFSDMILEERGGEWTIQVVIDI